MFTIHYLDVDKKNQTRIKVSCAEAKPLLRFRTTDITLQYFC